ncbi:MAG: DUF58 domain-containing protein [Deltaproteobacteria bacterium]|nr:MAG: DUF58 domain-containing protein [Deltaproteobacteria bacterium]
MIPTGRLVALAAVPLLLGVAAIGSASWIAPMIAVDLVLLSLVGLDAALSRAEFQIERRCASVQSVGRPFDVVIEIQNVGRRSLEAQVVDAPPQGPRPEPARLRLSSGETGTVRYEHRVERRGAHRFGPVTVRARSRLGFFELQLRSTPSTEVRVYPTFRQLRSWGLLAREGERQAPVRVRRRPGGESEFERLRPYVRGDSYRHVDWKATARRRGLVTREFGQEVNQNVIFLIDAGRMMSAEVQGRPLFDHALDAALGLGQVALRHGDRVGLVLYDDQIRAWSPPSGGARAGFSLVRTSYDVFASTREPDHARALRWLGQKVRRRSLVILLTSVIDEANAQAMERVVTALGRRHLPLCVWLRDPGLQALAERQVDEGLYVAGAAAELLEERARNLDRASRRGALVLDVSPDRLTAGLLTRYLEIKARRLL